MHLRKPADLTYSSQYARTNYPPEDGTYSNEPEATPPAMVYAGQKTMEVMAKRRESQTRRTQVLPSV